MINKIKLLFNTVIGNKQIKSYLKTFLVVFISVAFAQIELGGDITQKTFWIAVAGSALRNIIKTILGDFRY